MRTIFSTLVLTVLLGTTVFSQDEPCTAFPLECNADPIIGTFDDYTANPEYPIVCGQQFSTDYPMIWFTFESNGELSYLFYSDLFDSITSEHKAKLYTGESCTDLTQLTFCDSRKYFKGFFPEGTYYVQIRQKANVANQNNFSAGVLCADAPVNDNLCDAISIDFNVEYTGILVGASESFADDDNTVYDGSGGDVWFKFEADSTKSYDFIGKDDQSIIAYLATDTCSEISRLFGGRPFNTFDLYGVVGEGTIYIKIAPSNYDAARLLRYGFEVRQNDLPDNGFACDATILSSQEGTVIDSIDGAPADLTPCLSTASYRLPSRWYKYSADTDGSLSINACGFLVGVYGGSCDDFQCLGISGTVCSIPFNVDVVPGEDYFIRIEGVSGQYELEYSFTSSDFCPDLGFVGNTCSDGTPLTYNDVITSDCECIGEPIPQGSLCQNAFPIEENQFSIDYYNPFFEVITTPFFHNLYDIPPFLDSLGSETFDESCYVAKDVVFSFTPETDKFVDITASITDSNVEPNITILTGCPFTTAHVAEGCGSENFFVKEIENFHALADTTYYILIDGKPQLPGFDFNVDPLIEVVQKTFCPDLGAFEFDPCDDGNPLTLNDQIRENCECLGDASPEDFCENATEILPTLGLTVSPTSVDEEQSIYSGAEQCVGGNGAKDTWFYFDALSTNMIIGAKGKPNYDVALEVFDVCVGDRLACKNANGEGDREVKVLIDCVVGDRYFYRVYEANGAELNSSVYNTAVSFFPFTQLDLADCENTVLNSNDAITALVPEFEYNINRWYFEFTELAAPFSTYEVNSPNGSSPSLNLSQFDQLEEGRSYSVRVRGGIKNGQVQGDYGEACMISIIEGSGIGLDGGNAAANYAAVKLELFPNPANGQEVSLRFANLSGAEEQIVVRVFDLVGREVLTQRYVSSSKSSVFALGLEELSDGMYTVSASVDGSIISRKLLVE